MAGYARYTAVLDACVLHGALISNALISLAVEGLFSAKWSNRIDDEWTASLGYKRPDLLPEKIIQRRDAMRTAIPDWEVPEPAVAALLPGLSLPDPDDHHVLAAAIAGHADCIVTRNLKDFPEEVLYRFNWRRCTLTASSSVSGIWIRFAPFARSRRCVPDCVVPRCRRMSSLARLRGQT
jgi:predicted nucleic acid-binding protein